MPIGTTCLGNVAKAYNVNVRNLSNEFTTLPGHGFKVSGTLDFSRPQFFSKQGHLPYPLTCSQLRSYLCLICWGLPPQCPPKHTVWKGQVPSVRSNGSNPGGGCTIALVVLSRTCHRHTHSLIGCSLMSIALFSF